MVNQLYSNDFIESIERLKGSKVVFRSKKQQMTSGDLLASSTYLATALKEIGLTENSRVLLAVKPSSEFIIILFANMMLGSIISIIDPEMGEQNYKNKFAQFDPQFVFVDSSILLLNEHPILKFVLKRLNIFMPFFPNSTNGKVISTGIKLPLFTKNIHISSLTREDANEKVKFIKSNPNREFLVIYTSGTLSKPKGVVHTLRSIGNSVSLLSKLLVTNKNKSIATHLPHFILLGIMAGMEVHLWKENLSVKSKTHFINKHKITTLFGPPSDFTKLFKYWEKEENIPGTLTNVYLGSAPIYHSFLSKYPKILSKLKLLASME